MKQLAMRAVPFSKEQISMIEKLITQYGYSLLQLDENKNYSEDVLKHSELLVGYFPFALIKKATPLKWYHTPSAGVDKFVDVSIYPNANVMLTNSSGAFGNSIAEHLIMSALILLRKARIYQKQQQEKVWKNAGEIGSICNSVVTIIGMGNIGNTFAKYCKAMGAIVRGVKSSDTKKPDYVDTQYLTADINKAIEGADIVASCLPYTKHTDKLIDENCISSMKKTTIFLNVGRGKTVDQTALIKALSENRIAGAALDVAEIEPMPQDCPLWEMENVIVTPHMSGHDDDILNANSIFDIYYKNLCSYMSGGKLDNVVDFQKGY